MELTVMVNATTQSAGASPRFTWTLAVPAWGVLGEGMLEELDDPPSPQPTNSNSTKRDRSTPTALSIVFSKQAPIYFTFFSPLHDKPRKTSHLIYKRVREDVMSVTLQVDGTGALGSKGAIGLPVCVRCGVVEPERYAQMHKIGRPELPVVDYDNGNTSTE
jgi:hypothetical protein